MNHRDNISKSASLRSILALSAGAAAVPAVSNAAVQATLFETPITIDVNTSHVLDLPGDHFLEFRFGSHSYSGERVNYIRAFFLEIGAGRIGLQNGNRSVTGTARSGGSMVAFRTDAIGANWDAPAKEPVAFHQARIVASQINTYTPATFRLGPPGFNQTNFLLFQFFNTETLSQNYGFVQMSGATVNPGNPNSLSVTLTGWAWETQSNTYIDTFVIPEPSSAAMAMGGALVLGAAGLRRWRKRKPASRVADFV